MTAGPQLMGRERRIIRASTFRPKQYWFGNIGWVVYFVSPIAPGWLISRIFDQYQDRGATSEIVPWLVVLVLVEIATVWGLAIVHRQYMRGAEAGKALIRANVVDAQLVSGGRRAGRRNMAVGDVLVRLRDDPFDMIFLIDNWVDLFGAILYGSVAVWLLVQIDPLAAAVGVGPLIATGFANRAVAHLARRYRDRARATASEVSGFLAATFEASLTVKVTGAQKGVLDRLDHLNAKRAKAAVSDGLWNELSWNVNSMLADVFVGMAIVVAARGRLTTGDIALFFAYLTGMTWLPMRLGSLVATRRRYDVSEERLQSLTAPDLSAAEALLKHRPLTVLGGPPVPAPLMPSRVPLEALEVRGLTVHSRGLADVNFTVRRGEIVVITGAVGTGKSSLLRALLGLLDIDSGEVCWNGEVVGDRAAFFVPPQSAYVAQVPRLFAESLASNLRLGHDVSSDQLANAIALAAFDTDVAMLPNGLDTLVGARGVRLSGGQAQRTAAARAFVHRPELLVFDDLTSALDLGTELAMWDRLSSAGFTVLTTSNRPLALARASQIVDLGRTGTLAGQVPS